MFSLVNLPRWCELFLFRQFYCAVQKLVTLGQPWGMLLLLGTKFWAFSVGKCWLATIVVSSSLVHTVLLEANSQDIQYTYTYLPTYLPKFFLHTDEDGTHIWQLITQVQKVNRFD